VRVIEALLLERPLEIPVSLGHEHEIGSTLAHPRDGDRPEGVVESRAAIARARPLSPRARDDVWQDEHGHVAAHAIALLGDGLEHAYHCLPEALVTVVELQRVRPAREVWVPAVGQDRRARPTLGPPVISRLAGQVLLAAGHVELRVLWDPRVIER